MKTANTMKAKYISNQNIKSKSFDNLKKDFKICLWFQNDKWTNIYNERNLWNIKK